MMNSKETLEILINAGMKKIDVANILDIHRNSLDSILKRSSNVHTNTREKIEILSKCLKNIPSKTALDGDTLAKALRVFMQYYNFKISPDNPHNRIEEIKKNLITSIQSQTGVEDKQPLILIVAEKDTTKDEVAVHLKIAIQIKFSKNAIVISDDEYYQFIKANPLPDKTFWYMGDNREKRKIKFCYQFEKYADSKLDLAKYTENVVADDAYIRTSLDGSFVIFGHDTFWLDGGDTLYQLTEIYVNNCLNFDD
jgi:hypothetical protein